MRKQFTFYRSFWESIDNLPTSKEKLQAFQIICRYALDQIEPQVDDVKPSVCAVFQAFKPILDTAHARAAHTIRMRDLQTLTANNLYEQD